MSTNYLAQYNANLSTFNAVNINYSTLTGSTITVSTIFNSTITTRQVNFSTMVGSTITASTMTTQSMGYSTLTGSSVTASTIGVNTMSVSTMNVSTLTASGPIIANNPAALWMPSNGSASIYITDSSSSLTSGTTTYGRYFGTGGVVYQDFYGTFQWRGAALNSTVTGANIMNLTSAGNLSVPGNVQSGTAGSTYFNASGTQKAGGIFITGDITAAQWQLALTGGYNLGFLVNNTGTSGPSSNYTQQIYFTNTGGITCNGMSINNPITLSYSSLPSFAAGQVGSTLQATGSSSQVISSDTNTNLVQLTIPPGIWVISSFYMVQSTGIYVTAITTAFSGISNVSQSINNAIGANTAQWGNGSVIAYTGFGNTAFGQCYSQNHNCFATISSSTTYYLVVRLVYNNTSTNSLSVINAYLNALRIA